MFAHRSFTGSLILRDRSSGSILPCLCHDMSCDLGSSPQVYDHSLGLLDAPGGFSPIQEKIYRYSNLAPHVSASGFYGPSHNRLIEAARLPNATNLRHDVGLIFFRHNPIQAESILDAVISKFTLTITAGEPVTWNADFDAPQWMAGLPAGISSVLHGNGYPMEPAKILTWDRCEIFTSFGEVQSMTLSVVNNIDRIYTASSIIGNGPAGSGQVCKEIRIGKQEVSGTLSLFSPQQFAKRGPEIITFTLNGHRWRINVAYSSPSNPATGNNIFLSTVAFRGVAYSGSEGTWLS